MSEDGHNRDVGNHILFEIATEVANRGQLLQLLFPGDTDLA